MFPDLSSGIPHTVLLHGLLCWGFQVWRWNEAWARATGRGRGQPQKSWPLTGRHRSLAWASYSYLHIIHKTLMTAVRLLAFSVLQNRFQAWPVKVQHRNGTKWLVGNPGPRVAHNESWVPTKLLYIIIYENNMSTKIHLFILYTCTSVNLGK